MDNPLNDYEHLRPQKPQNGRPRNGFIQKRGDHFDRFVTNHRPKTATPGVAGSLTDIMEMHLHVWRVSRVQNAHVWRGTAPPFAIPSHVPPKALHRGKSELPRPNLKADRFLNPPLRSLMGRPTIWVPDGVLDHLWARETALARPNMPLLDRFFAPSFP